MPSKFCDFVLQLPHEFTFLEKEQNNKIIAYIILQNMIIVDEHDYNIPIQGVVDALIPMIEMLANENLIFEQF